MNEILAKIEAAPIICVFRHQAPDPDALGSQWGLVNWLKESYPNKEVYAMGWHRGQSANLFGTYETVSDDVVRKSLAIILDTANAARIDDDRYQFALDSIKLDHHPFTDAYAKYEFIDDTAASTSELVCRLIQLKSRETLSQTTARYLYMGILTDTLRFSTSNTSASTLHCAAFLVNSDLNLSQINDDLFGMERIEFELTNYIRTHAVIEENGLVYIKLDRPTLEKLRVTPGLAKERVNELGLVRSFEIWALLIEHEEDGLIRYNGSLRSRRLSVNDIAQKYNGGGHRLAAAVKHLTDKEVDLCLEDCRKRIRGEI